MNRLLKHPWAIIVSTLLLTALFGSFIPKLVMDNDVRAYFPHEHPSYLKAERIGDTFGSLIQMDVALEAEGPTILTADYLAAIGAITAEIEAAEQVDKVQSLTNADYIVGIEGGLSAETLVPAGFDGSPEAVAELRRRIVDWGSMYKRLLVSEDFKGSQIIVSIDDDIRPEQTSALLSRVTEICERHAAPGLSFRQAGDPVLSDLAKSYMKRDLAALIPVVILVVLLCLLFAFRRLEGMLLPLITVMVSTVWMVGLMAILGVKFTIISSCLPVVLIAVGSAYGIHVLNHYYEEIRAGTGSGLDRKGHAELVSRSTKAIVKPVILAGLTTIAGFVSNLTSPIEPLKVFSIFSSLGVAISLILALTLIPALLAVKRRLPSADAGRPEEGRRPARLGAFAEAAREAVMRRPGRVVAAFAAVMALASWGFAKLDIESSIINYFPADSRIRRDVAYIDERFAGSNMLSLVVSGPEKGSMTDPEALAAMDGLAGYLVARHPEIGKIASFSDFVRRMNKVMHDPEAEGGPSAEAGAGASPGAGEEVASFFEEEAAPAPVPAAPAAPPGAGQAKARLDAAASMAEALGLLERAYARLGGGEVRADELLAALEAELNYGGAAYDEIPLDAAKYRAASKQELANLVSQYLMLYSGSLEDFADDAMRPRSARMQLALRSHSTKVTQAVIDDAAEYAARHFPAGYSLEAGGIAELECSLSDMIIGSQAASVAVAAAAVVLILWISFGSLAAGLIGCLPLLISILVNYGIMGFAGIDLDMVTSLVSSIAIGIGIDYTIHFMSNYHRERLKSDDLPEVTRATLRVSGKAIAVNAVSVGLGFLVLCLSKFVVLRYIGLLVAIVMLTSSVPALTVLPFVLNVCKPAFISRPPRPRRGEPREARR